MTEQHQYTDNDIGKRVRYTDRKGRIQYGTIRSGPAHTFIDIALDGSARDRYYVPVDTVVLVTPEEEELLGNSQGN